MYGGPLQLHFFKRRVIYELGSHFNQIRFIQRNDSEGGSISFFQLTLTINITPLTVTLRILEKDKIKSALRAIR